MRALRATLVMPALFALTYKVIGDLQMALFAGFGSFANLVLASFGGTRRDKAVAHFALAVTGSITITIGTAVSGITWLAAVVTIPVAFAIFFLAGIAGPVAASGVTAVLLTYVLPVGSAGAASTIPSRLAGWWLASAASTAAVLLLSTRSPGDRLRGAAAASATALAAHLRAAARDEATPAHLEASIAAKHELMARFDATPYRPTGLATADQALASVVQFLEWCTILITDALDGHLNLSRAARPDRELLAVSADVLRDAAALLGGTSPRGEQDAIPDIDRLEHALAASADYQRALAADPSLAGDLSIIPACVKHAFHAQAIAAAARTIAADALIVTKHASPEIIAGERRRWYDGQEADPQAVRGPGALASAAGIAVRHASLRSVWVRNGLRGAIALAVAVSVADLSGVQHGFWVVLGTLSVLRSNAAATGSTALRALAGTVLGFVVGAALLLGIGTGQVALWVALPIAVLVAAYAPGTAPFLVGQAAFTVTVVVLFNLLVPAGWKVGLLRIEDVAIGCAVSLVVGVLFWPRGVAGVVGDDLADAYRRGGAYLTQSVDWALGLRPAAPDTGVAAVTASDRLDDALRAYLAEQGAKRVRQEDLWRLVMATLRLRLTARSLATADGREAPASSGPPGPVDGVRAGLQRLTAELTGFYDRLAAEVGRPARGELVPAEAPLFSRDDGRVPQIHQPYMLWVYEHLHHLSQNTAALTQPALRVAEVRRTPWWR